MLLVLHRMDVTALLPIFRDRLELQQSTLVVIGINAILYIITCSANRYGQASRGIHPSSFCPVRRSLKSTCGTGLRFQHLHALIHTAHPPFLSVAVPPHSLQHVSIT